MNTRTRTTTATITIVLLALVIASFNVSPASALTVPHQDAVWGAGFGAGPTSFQPWNVGTDQGWDNYIMYEPMFGTNVATGQLIKWLGSDISWLNSTAIQITLKSTANWTDGTAITADDVIFDFKLLQQQNMTGALCDFKGNGRLGGNISDTFIKVNSKTFVVLIKNATYAGSEQVYRGLTNGWPIFPKSVWTQINATYGIKDLKTFANDWQDASTKAEWKVASGMYLPYWHDAVTTIMQRNENWWGKNDVAFSRLPYPKYVGYTGYASNELAVLALERGDIDWCGKYIADVGTVKAANPNVLTYFGAPYYFADKACKLLVPNYQAGYPINQSWLHKAIAWGLDYAGLSALSSGYLKTPSPFYIPWDDAAARALVNTTLEAQYQVNYTASIGLAILEYYCTYDSATGYWFTKLGSELAGNPTTRYPLAHWDGSTNASITPWAITNFYGWTDVTVMDLYAAQQLTTGLLKLKMTTDQGSANTWAGTHTKVNGAFFDFYHHVMAGQFNMDTYQRYFQLFSPKSPDSGGGIAAPLGNYSNPTLVALIEQIDTKPSGSLEQKIVVNDIEEILGEEMPFIPYCGHPDWQIYSNTYWINWPSQTVNPILPSSPYAGLSQNANLHLIYFSLLKNPLAPTVAPAADNTLLIVGLVVIVVAVVAVAAVVLIRKKPGK